MYRALRKQWMGSAFRAIFANPEQRSQVLAHCPKSRFDKTVVRRPPPTVALLVCEGNELRMDMGDCVWPVKVGFEVFPKFEEGTSEDCKFSCGQVINNTLAVKMMMLKVGLG
eukprot:2896150-Rhodomonas_salina.1